MRECRFLLLVLAFLTVARVGAAQDVISVDGPTLDQHVNHRVAPLYPADARQAGIQGTVALEVQVGTTGKVESMNVMSGPDLLQQAAIDCLKQWTFYPFEKDGVPVEATGPVFIEFSPGKDVPGPDKEKLTSDKDKPAPDKVKLTSEKEKPAPAEDKKEERIADQYSPASDECKKDLAAGTDYKAAFDACRKAAEIVEEFAPDRRFIEKRTAFVSAAWASLYGGYAKAALTYAGKAVDVVKLGHDDDAGGNAAYGVRGVIEGKLGELINADQDLTLAEDCARKEIASAQSEAPDDASAIEEYKQPFVLELRFHAQILQALDHADEAQKKLDEAAKYE